MKRHTQTHSDIKALRTDCFKSLHGLAHQEGAKEREVGVGYLIEAANIACQFVKEAFQQDPELVRKICRKAALAEFPTRHFLDQRLEKEQDQILKKLDLNGIQEQKWLRQQGELFHAVQQYVRVIYTNRAIAKRDGGGLAQLPDLGPKTIGLWAKAIAQEFNGEAAKFVKVPRAFKIRKQRAKRRFDIEKARYRAIDDVAGIQETRLQQREKKIESMKPTERERMREFEEAVRSCLRSIVAKAPKV